MLSYAVHHTLGDEISLRGQSRRQISNIGFYQDQVLIKSRNLIENAKTPTPHVYAPLSRRRRALLLIKSWWIADFLFLSRPGLDKRPFSRFFGNVSGPSLDKRPFSRFLGILSGPGLDNAGISHFYQDQLLINGHFLDSSAQETLLHHSVTALAEDETTIQGSHGCDCSSRRKSMRSLPCP